MKKEYVIAATVLPLLLAAYTAHATGTGAGEEGCAPRARLADLSTLFSDSGACAKLPEGSRYAIRAFDEQTALSNFRGFKKVWLQNFDKFRPDSLTARLSTTIDPAFNLSLSLPVTAPSVIRLQNVIAKVNDLHRAVDLIRPDGGTTVDHLNQLEVALRAVPRQEFAADAQMMIDRTAAGLTNLKQILYCRLADQEMAQKRIEAQKECGSQGAPLPALASVYQMMVGPIEIVAHHQPVSENAIHSSAHANQDSLAQACTAEEEPLSSQGPQVQTMSSSTALANQ